MWSSHCCREEWAKEYGLLREVSCITNCYIKVNSVPIEDTTSGPMTANFIDFRAVVSNLKNLPSVWGSKLWMRDAHV